MSLNQESPKMPDDAPHILVIGGGSRGNAYSRALVNPPTNVDPKRIVPGVIVGVAEPEVNKRRRFIEQYILNGQWCVDGDKEYLSFNDWREMVTDEGKKKMQEVGVDGILICTLDHTHEEIILCLRIHFPTTHIFSEKPLTPTLPSLLRLHASLLPRTLTPPSILFSVGHVLRYSPLILLLKHLLCAEQSIGEILHIDWTEPVGHWHFAHSYVRGNWSNDAPSLLTKSCHDVDILLWLLCSPHYTPPNPDSSTRADPQPSHLGTPGLGARTTPHFPSQITSTGRILHFRKASKPPLAGMATNCFSCLAEPTCIYSAKKIYIDRHLKRNITGWPVKIVCPDIEDLELPRDYAIAERLLMEKLGEDYDSPGRRVPGKRYYGRCVYESENADVVDTQITTITWNDEYLPSAHTASPLPGHFAKSATLNMIAHTHNICERRGHIYGTTGELEFSATTNIIKIYSFITRKTTTYDVQEAIDAQSGHGGGDFGLVNAFVGAIRAVKSLGWEVERAQREWIGMSIEEGVLSHAVVWAAEEARREGKIVEWNEWWDRVRREAGGGGGIIKGQGKVDILGVGG